MNASIAPQVPADAYGLDLDLDALIAGSHLTSTEIDLDVLLAGSHLATLDASVRTALEGMDLDLDVDALIGMGRMGRAACDEALAA